LSLFALHVHMTCPHVFLITVCSPLIQEPFKQFLFYWTEPWWLRGLIKHNQFLTLYGARFESRRCRICIHIRWGVGSNCPQWVRIRRLPLRERLDVSRMVRMAATDTKVRGLNGCNLKILVASSNCEHEVPVGKGRQTKRSMGHLLIHGMA
jgi:hypothetical protein